MLPFPPKIPPRPYYSKPLKNGMCFNCETFGPCHQHHVVPKARGGKKTVPLCEKCHGFVHDRKFLNHQFLTRLGIENAKKAGKVVGRRNDSGKSYPIQEYLESGKSLRAFCLEKKIPRASMHWALKNKRYANTEIVPEKV